MFIAIRNTNGVEVHTWRKNVSIILFQKLRDVKKTFILTQGRIHACFSASRGRLKLRIAVVRISGS